MNWNKQQQNLLYKELKKAYKKISTRRGIIIDYLTLLIRSKIIDVNSGLIGILKNNVNIHNGIKRILQQHYTNKSHRIPP